jgi:hypothetical protein
MILCVFAHDNDDGKFETVAVKTCQKPPVFIKTNLYQDICFKKSFLLLTTTFLHVLKIIIELVGDPRHIFGFHNETCTQFVVGRLMSIASFFVLVTGFLRRCGKIATTTC